MSGGCPKGIRGTRISSVKITESYTLEEITGDIYTSSRSDQIQLDKVAQSHVQLSLSISKEVDSTTFGKLVAVFNQFLGENCTVEILLDWDFPFECFSSGSNLIFCSACFISV